MLLFLQQQFDKILLFLLFCISIIVYVYNQQEFTQGLVSTVIGALILALTGRGSFRASDSNKPPDGK